MSTLIAAYALSPTTRLEISEGDLTQEPVDAIVNAANEHLAHGGGIAAAIVRAGGQSIQNESNAWVRQHGLVTYADPAYTQAGRLPARYVIHAVGPRWGDGDEDHKLAQAISGSLKRAEALGLCSIAFPAISTGIFGFPKERAARIFFETFINYFSANPSSPLQLVRLTLWGDEMARIFRSQADLVFDRRADV